MAVHPVAERNQAAALLRGRTTTVDEEVTHAFRIHLAGAFSHGIALVAVGGYGRRELFPSSDIDLLILAHKEPERDQERQSLSLFLRSLWDQNLRLSQSVRTIAECTRFDETNIELSVSLLDARFLIGDSDLYDQLAEKLGRYFRSHRPQLLEKLCELTTARHARYLNTIHHLEPNIKEAPGGIRDLHVIDWINKLRETPLENEPALEDAREFLWHVRAILHQRAGRDQNVLSFDAQEAMAPDAAAWMREYYRHARVVRRHVMRAIEACEASAGAGLIRSFRDWRSRVSNAEFTVVRDRVMARTPHSLTEDPALLFRLLEFSARHGIRLSFDTERRISEAVDRGTLRFPERKALWPALRAILQQPYCAIALHAMHETGLLHTIFPAWHDVDSLVIRDFYHRYTVDEHSLTAVEHIDRLRNSADLSRRRFAEMASETSDIPLLAAALLFHDVGKSDGLEGHAAASARKADSNLRAIGMSDEERALACFLIERHLDISVAMNTRDLNDPATAIELATRVETLEKLRYLTLLTYADISAVNPDSMTPWRLEQLWHAYLITHRELTRELDTGRIHSALLTGSDDLAAWLEGFPVRYVRTHSAQQIERHRRMAREALQSGAAVEIERRFGAWQLTVVTSDRHGLLAGLAGAVSSFGMNIVRAEAFSNSRGTVLDHVTFEDPLRTLELNPSEVGRMASVVRRVILGKDDVEKLLEGRPRPAAPSRAARIVPSVFFDNEASSGATLVEITAQDRPGLFYDLARTFASAGCSIEVVLIDTEAHKAIDVFYVTRDHAKLGPAMQADLRLKLLEICNL